MNGTELVTKQSYHSWDMIIEIMKKFYFQRLKKLTSLYHLSFILLNSMFMNFSLLSLITFQSNNTLHIP